MLLRKKGPIEWLEFELLADIPGLSHGVFLRKGGISQDPYTSLNVTMGTGDDPSNVRHNREQITKILRLEQLVSAYHVHSTHIEHVTAFKETYPDCDGLMTSKRNWGLMATHADCQAAIFYDSVHRAVAVVHAGWRGQVQNIYQKTILNMHQTFGSRANDLIVCICPSLGPQNAEFKNYQQELPKEWEPFQIKPTYFDLWAIARHQLESCGILPSHIEIAKINTYAYPSDYFSYRRDKIRGGCNGTVVGLN